MPGSRLAVRGDGVETKYGRVIHAREAGGTIDDLSPIKAKDKGKPPEPGPKASKPTPEQHAS
jgi:hypothetical protein